MGRPRKTIQEEPKRRDDPTWEKTVAFQAYRDFMKLGDPDSVRYAHDIVRQWRFNYKGKRMEPLRATEVRK